MDLLKSISASAQELLLPIPAPSKSANHCVIFWSGAKIEGLKKLLKDYLEDWQIAQFEKISIQEFVTKKQTVWVLCADYYEGEWDARGRARDLCGSWLRTKKVKGDIHFHFAKAESTEIFGAILGLGLASYKFIDICKKTENTRRWLWLKNNKKLSAKEIQEPVALYRAMNLTRHLTNMPADVANPQNLSVELSNLLKGRKGLKVDVLNESDLKKEKMGLLVGVGQGSRTGARLLHFKYLSDQKNKKRIAFVGKGVTFDTGGLDIKNSSGMRLMKKDMAGAAAMAGLCYFVSELQLKHPFDFYLPLAENAVSADATRPGDIHQSRSGLSVEIDNTDAEGRLVMADAFDYAIHPPKGNKPAALIDVATLTGAMRVAVGLDVAGFFSTHDKLARQIEKSAKVAGEWAWRMPLVDKYSKGLSSSFADCKNSSDSGFGGAITAALFLKKFVDDVPWLHFDVMSWSNSGDGALCEGANGQCMQILAEYILAGC